MLRAALGVATADEERFEAIERRLGRVKVSLPVMTPPPASQSPDDRFLIGVRLTPVQFRELYRRASLNTFDGKARGEYILGCALDEPRGPAARLCTGNPGR